MRHFIKVETMSNLKARADEILDQLAADDEPVLITQNGEAQAVLQDIRSFERTQEALALLKLLALGQREVDAGKLTPARDVIARLKATIRRDQKMTPGGMATSLGDASWGSTQKAERQLSGRIAARQQGAPDAVVPGQPSNVRKPTLQGKVA